jgi:hypothetical protein
MTSMSGLVTTACLDRLLAAHIIVSLDLHRLLATALIVHGGNLDDLLGTSATSLVVYHV